MNQKYLNKPRALPWASRFLGKSLIVLLLVGACLSTGCMRRRITIRSNPSGALVFVDNQEVGTTPTSLYVNYYGTRDIRLEKERFKTVAEQHTFRTPWYQVPPLDLISDNFLFREQRDERVVNFVLEPLPNINNRKLRDDANELRARVRQGTVVSPSGVPTPNRYPPVGVPGDGLY